MADVIGISDVSSKDVGAGSQLKTGNLKRSHNMPKDCVAKKVAGGMSKKAAVKACYPADKKGSKKEGKSLIEKQMKWHKRKSLPKSSRPS